MKARYRMEEREGWREDTKITQIGKGKIMQKTAYQKMESKIKKKSRVSKRKNIKVCWN